MQRYRAGCVPMVVGSSTDTALEKNVREPPLRSSAGSHEFPGPVGNKPLMSHVAGSSNDPPSVLSDASSEASFHPERLWLDDHSVDERSQDASDDECATVASDLTIEEGYVSTSNESRLFRRAAARHRVVQMARFVERARDRLFPYKNSMWRAYAERNPVPDQPIVTLVDNRTISEESSGDDSDASHTGQATRSGDEENIHECRCCNMRFKTYQRWVRHLETGTHQDQFGAAVILRRNFEREQWTLQQRLRMLPGLVFTGDFLQLEEVD